MFFSGLCFIFLKYRLDYLYMGFYFSYFFKKVMYFFFNLFSVLDNNNKIAPFILLQEDE